MRRNYSLCSAPDDRRHYQIAVKREGQWAWRLALDGGWWPLAHLMVARRATISCSTDGRSRCLRRRRDWHHADPVDDAAPQSRRHRALPFVLLHSRRCQHRVRGELAIEFPGQFTLHHDGGDATQAFDFWPLFSHHRCHVYCCGPGA